jgi:hypothetical protein
MCAIRPFREAGRHATEGGVMYIGLGTALLIVILLVILL